MANMYCVSFIKTLGGSSSNVVYVKAVRFYFYKKRMILDWKNRMTSATIIIVNIPPVAVLY